MVQTVSGVPSLPVSLLRRFVVYVFQKIVEFLHALAKRVGTTLGNWLLQFQYLLHRHCLTNGRVGSAPADSSVDLHETGFLVTLNI